MRVFETSSEHAIRCNHAESYLPALRYLLFDLYIANTATRIHTAKRRLLTEAYLLHLLCVLDDVPAYLRDRAALARHGPVMSNVGEQVLTASLRNNYALWQRARQRAPAELRVLIDGGAGRMRRMYLDRIGAAYMQIPVDALGLGARMLGTEASARGWTVEGGIVVVKKAKRT